MKHFDSLNNAIVVVWSLIVEYDTTYLFNSAVKGIPFPVPLGQPSGFVIIIVQAASLKPNVPCLYRQLLTVY